MPTFCPVKVSLILYYFRYLSKTFERALYHVDPNIIVFLGDIMDEGSISKNDEYKRYLERFHGIFYIERRVKVSLIDIYD